MLLTGRGRPPAGALLLRRNEALEAELRATARELRASRARIFSAAARERRRIETDLHDAGQNRLVALRIKLELAAERAQADGASEELQSTLAGLRDEAQEALDALRAIARGICPPLLAVGGLRSALEREVAQTPLGGRVIGGAELPRSSAAAEAAVWFSCLEALQNAGKHAGPQARVTVRLDRVGDLLRFSVADDGRGFAPGTPTAGAGGLTHMRDRALAAGGTLEVLAAPGRGTVVRGSVPWPTREEAGTS